MAACSPESSSPNPLPGGGLGLAFPFSLCYKWYLISAMNGKITVKRRQERSGHRLQARLRTPGLVRPGASVETRRNVLRYQDSKCARLAV